jgi:Caspase domain
MLKKTLVFVSLALSLYAAQATAGNRVALVIGNLDYDQLTDLTKSLNDARAIRDTLQTYLGFSVIYGENLDRRGMNRAINELDASISKDDIVFVYYSGHGVSLGAENYLVPTDLAPPSEGEEELVAGDSFGVESLTRRIQARGAKAIFIILDACRNNPFERPGGKSIGAAQGLSKIDAADGVFTLFGAGLGETALDRLSDSDSDPNSVFTRALIPLLKIPGLTQVDIAKRVQQDVAALAATVKHSQKPAYYDQMLGFVTLRDAVELKPLSELLAPADDLPSLDSLQLPDSPSAEQLAFQAAQADGSPEAMAEFQRNFPDSTALFDSLTIKKIDFSAIMKLKEKADFEAAQKDGSDAAFEAFNKKYPNSTILFDSLSIPDGN